MYKGFFKKSLISFFFILFFSFMPSNLKCLTMTFYSKTPINLSELPTMLSSIFSGKVFESLTSMLGENNKESISLLPNLQDCGYWGLKDIDYCKEILNLQDA